MSGCKNPTNLGIKTCLDPAVFKEFHIFFCEYDEISKTMIKKKVDEKILRQSLRYISIFNIRERVKTIKSMPFWKYLKDTRESIQRKNY